MTAEENGAIGLLNTVRLRDGVPFDAIRAPAALVSWLEAMDLPLAPGWAAPFRAPPAARRLLTEAQRLREDTERLFEAYKNGDDAPRDALYGLNRVLGAGRISHSLRMDPDGARLIELERGADPCACLAPIARAAAEVLIGTEPTRLRRCASDRCTRWFIDTSKGGRRKWCSMARCGNRAKATRHRQRIGAA